MQYILILMALLTMISFVADKKKTIMAIKKGAKQFLNILPTLLSVIIAISVIFYFISNDSLREYLGESAGIGAYFSAALFGSIAILPGFISYPIAGILANSGVSLSVIAVFITTLKMVGFLTLPIEKRFFGYKVALLRNALSFGAAILIGTIMALILNYL